ncbi:transcriptional regulator LldR [Klebsiella pneumoniae]|nr:transcriptional regulator LldR [Klebsiella pneumoniae]
MGVGIACHFARHGHAVRLYDTDPQRLAEVPAVASAILCELEASGQQDPADRDAVLARLTPTPTLNALADATLLIEAIPERLALKHALYAELETLIADETIIASNTSGLPPDRLAPGRRHPERVLIARSWQPPAPLPPVARGPRGRPPPPPPGVSRTSPREALAMLVNEGVLLSRRGGGTFVRFQHEPWSEQNIVQPLKTLLADDPDYSFDILEARHAIEASTAWHAAMRATDADKEKIRLCFEATQSEDPDIASQADVRFHLAIAEASHNVVLLQTMRGFFDLLHSSVKQSRQRMYQVPPVFARLTEQHQAVMEAIVAGDAEAARQAMMGHLGFVHATIKRFDEDQARQARITRLPGDHNENSRENS